jgi:hypothetical protein
MQQDGCQCDVRCKMAHDIHFNNLDCIWIQFNWILIQLFNWIELNWIGIELNWIGIQFKLHCNVLHISISYKNELMSLL